MEADNDLGAEQGAEDSDDEEFTVAGDEEEEEGVCVCVCVCVCVAANGCA